MIRFCLVLALLGTLTVAAASTSSAAQKKLTPTELKWITPLLKVWTLQNDGLNLVIKAATAKNALLLGSKPNNEKLAVVLGTLLSCKKPHDQIVAAGKAPTARMRAFSSALNSACIHDENGAQAFSKAMIAYTGRKAKLTGTLLAQGIAQFKTGSAQISKAYTAITSLGGKQIFTA